MSDHSIDPEQAAQISKRISQAFDFARDLIENPESLDEIPDRATLVIRDPRTNGDPSSPAERQPASFYSFWQADQAIDALRLLADFLERAPTDPYLWKWVVLVMHDALQGFMGLALRGSHGAQLLMPKHERRVYRMWAEERRLGKISPTREPRQVDSFLNLYEKIQNSERMGHYVHSRPFLPTPAQDEAIRALDSYRKELAHYGDSTLVVAVAWFPTMILEALSVIDWLLEESNNITIFPEDEERAREMIKLVREQASQLVDLFAKRAEKPTPQP